MALKRFTAQQVQYLQQALLAWYRAGHRDLPWRNTTDPYAIWVSEIMLQQTQVNTVIAYYHRFLQRFPTVVDLAMAHVDEVLKLWEGLGYYARARNMHKAAQLIASQHQGVFPKQYKHVVALPGIGQSTAGAILTFGHAKPHPILDGNVKRVLARVAAICEPIDDTKVIERMWGLSKQLLPKDPTDAHDFNQAIMELGATCCTQKQPKCNDCPWQQQCLALPQCLQDQLPIKSKKMLQPHFPIGVAVIFNPKGHVLIAQRPQDGLLGGLWEFPGGKCQADETLPDCVKREIKEETGINIDVESHLMDIKHAYTHFKVTLHVYVCRYSAKKAPKPLASQQVRWVNVAELEQFAFPKANLAIIEALKAHANRQLVLV